MIASYIPAPPSPTHNVLAHLLVPLSLSGLLLATACVNVQSADQTIYTSPDTVVRLEPARNVASLGNATYSHPILLTKDQLDILLTSISAQTKVGLIRSVIGDPGTPRLFDRTDISLLASPIQEALTKANPGQAIVFSRAKHQRGTRVLVTSGILFVHDKQLVVSIANFWHPVITSASEVGGKDRLEDVRETTAYVQDHPWISVGEQDFAIFFDDPKHQLGRYEHSLWDYPERTIAITYSSYLQANPDPARRAKESEEAVQHATMRKTEGQVITDLKKRLLELERANAALTEKLHGLPVTPVLSDSHPAGSTPLQPEQTSTEKLLEVIQRLEHRISEMEREIAKNRR